MYSRANSSSPLPFPGASCPSWSESAAGSSWRHCRTSIISPPGLSRQTRCLRLWTRFCLCISPPSCLGTCPGRRPPFWQILGNKRKCQMTNFSPRSPLMFWRKWWLFKYCQMEKYNHRRFFCRYAPTCSRLPWELMCWCKISSLCTYKVSWDVHVDASLII